MRRVLICDASPNEREGDKTLIIAAVVLGILWLFGLVISYTMR